MIFIFRLYNLSFRSNSLWYFLGMYFLSSGKCVATRCIHVRHRGPWDLRSTCEHSCIELSHCSPLDWHCLQHLLQLADKWHMIHACSGVTPKSKINWVTMEFSMASILLFLASFQSFEKRGYISIEVEFLISSTHIPIMHPLRSVTFIPFQPYFSVAERCGYFFRLVEKFGGEA